MMTAFLNADIERRFANGTTIRATLQQSVGGFSVTALVGPSGCGKTTVLRCLAGLDTPELGRVTFGDGVWFDATRRINLPPQSRATGFLFQEYALFPHLTVFENIAFGLARVARSETRRRAGELIDMLQLGGMEGRFPHQLSGGQQQRVALARTVAPRPRLLLLDEPLSALDAPTRAELRGELRRVLSEWAIPTIVVTHDAVEVRSLADEAVVMCEGQVRQHGPVDEVFSRPVDSEVARIVGT
jgi:molybdate transport system ATP-binding protein